MTAFDQVSAALAAGGTAQVEAAIAEFGRVLEDLHQAHAELADRAARMEQELEVRVAELEAILNGLPAGVIVRDAEGVVQRTNPAARELLGASPGELEGKGSIPLLDGLARDGSPCTLDLDRSPATVVALKRSEVRLPDGAVIGTVEILDDRTQLELMSQRMLQQAKMAALGTMAGGIAHEIRNPLNAVRGFASLLTERLADGSTEERWAHLIEEGVDECDAIVGSVMAFAAPERLCLEPLDARTVCESALGAVRRDLARNCRDEAFELRCSAPDSLAFCGDRMQVRQALRNLIANAVDAQPHGGIVCIEATQHGDCVEFRVHDAGPGIAPKNRARLTEPFFTTRAEGTGLGLALVHTVARLHGGSFQVGPDPGPLGGADMLLTLPLGDDSTPPTQSPTPCDAR